MSSKREWPKACNRIEVRFNKDGVTTILNGEDCATIINALLRSGGLTVNLEFVQRLRDYKDAQVEPACACYLDGGGEQDQTVWLEVDCSECHCGTPTEESLAEFRKAQAARDKKAAKKKGAKK